MTQHEQHVPDMRRKGEFIGTVERILNRKVRAFNSSIDTHTDVSVEIFHLEPDASRP